ncbi:unnamed protein product [Fraxinus pennsylvanica]|uniref:F-box domain-containing protein n=1 Tax=Fraxinus pennsylvanica TaxID=56036 RepID=A0AAD1ZL89_9LAMI|nr:unnamed protein product [Fraxinus pennsylvanica]
MKGSSDFVELLGPDLSMKIMMCLVDPSDLIRVRTVSISWREFVIANGLCKQLWHRMFPEVSSVDNIFEVTNIIEDMEFKTDDSTRGARLERDHRFTDNYPEESIKNTLEPTDVVDYRASYWSSKGESDASVPETLIYRLAARLCVISEIHENLLQKFKLPEPVFCIGEILKVELLGRVQTQETDELYYICITHVEVVGRLLLPGFDIKIPELGKCLLEYYHEAAHSSSPAKSSYGVR